MVYMLAGWFARAYHGQIEDVVATLKLPWESRNRAYLGKMDFRVKLERGMEQC
jgi:hypothetical protein